MGETKKRKLATAEGESSVAAPCCNSKKRCALQPLLEFLREKAVADHEVRQQKLEAMRKEKETQNSLMQSLMAQQQKMNQAL